MTIDEAKRAMRAEAIVRRAQMTGNARDTSSRRIAENFLKHVPLAKNDCVSAYIAIGEELDPKPLIDALRQRGHRIVLPRVAGKGKALVFHLYEANAALVPGPFGLSQPASDWPLIDPDVLAVPLLAFDKDGNRLGYGAGFYDRTIQDLRSRRKAIAAGYAFAGQEFAAIPHHDGDQCLDMVVTETGARRFTTPPE